MGALSDLMGTINELRVAKGAWPVFEASVGGCSETTEVGDPDSPLGQRSGGAIRARLWGGREWDVNMILLPPGAAVAGRQQTGSFTILNTMSSMTPRLS